MKKIVSVCLLLAFLALVFCFPISATETAISTNAEIILRELNACREAVLPTVKPDTLIQNAYPWESVVLFAAQVLDSLGVKEIAEITVAFEIEGEDILGFYHVQFADIDGKSYFMTMDEEGGAYFISAVNENGHEVIWMDYPPYFPPYIPPKWWHCLSPCLQWILRHIFFGWIWM